VTVWPLAAGALGLLLLAPSPVWPQEPSAPRFEVTVGPEWLGAADAGGIDASETGNGGGRVTLFRAASELRGGLGLAASLGARIWNPLWAEAWVRYHSARLTTRLSGDIEGASDVTAREAVQSFQVEGGAIWTPARLRLWRSMQLFAGGGGGYVRQLHSGQTLVETGQSVYAGGGAILSLPEQPGRAFKAGLRVDVRAAALRRAVVFDDRLHVAPALSASLLLRF
jgi:hypothetical protein